MNREKFKQMVHYVCWKCTADPDKLGAIKLNKILWLADFAHYYQTGHPISGARYVRRQFGPVPSAIVPVVRELVQERSLAYSQVDFLGHDKAEYRALRAPNMDGFDSEELEQLDSVIDLVCDGHTARSISEATHDHVWHAAADGEEIPYYTIFARPGKITDDELEWAQTVLGQTGDEAYS